MLTTIKATIELPVPPPGYEYTGEFRRVTVSDYYLNGDKVCKSNGNTCAWPYHIIKKVRWEPKTGDTVWLIGWYGSHCRSVKYRAGNDHMIRSFKKGLLFKTEEIAQRALDIFHLNLSEYDFNNQE